MDEVGRWAVSAVSPALQGAVHRWGAFRGSSVVLPGLQSFPPSYPGVHGGALGDSVCLSELPYYTHSCRRLKQQNCMLRKAPAKSSQSPDQRPPGFTRALLGDEEATGCSHQLRLTFERASSLKSALGSVARPKTSSEAGQGG